MKRILIILASALLLTGCGAYDEAGEEQESSSQEVTEEVAEEETEEETEPPTEEETEEETEPPTEEETDEETEAPTEEEHEEDPDVNADLHYQTGSVILSEVPEDLKVLPDGWITMTELGLSFAMPEGSVCKAPGEDSALIDGGGVTMNLVKDMTLTYNDEQFRELYTSAFAGVGKDFDGTNRSFFSCYFNITPEEYASADQETKDTLDSIATLYDQVDRVYHVEGKGVESFVLHFADFDQPSYCAFVVDGSDHMSLGVTYSDSSKDALRAAVSFGKE
ncbi:MAG: hypothetical protein IJ071_07275 [Ruminococcus sp.]|nr:hypothetical protein [Ruminococcus sp.]